MHVLFVHQNFPAQFGQIANHLVQNHGWQCTFASRHEGEIEGIGRVRYEPCGGARAETNFCSRSFENQIWHSTALFDALRSRPDVQPDLIVGHSGMVSTLYLRELYDVPILNYFEFFYRTHDSDIDFRVDLPPCDTATLLRARTRNALLLLDLENCDAGYAPTAFQQSQLPAEFRPKIRTIFDGIDTDFWKPIEQPNRRVAGIDIPSDHRVLTYVSRGMESMRGFDIFMQIADRVCRQRQDVSVLVVGEDRIAYGGDARFTEGKTFKEWFLNKHAIDLSRIHFVGRVRPSELVNVFSLSDVHLYLTVPFTLSWSLFNAMSCGALAIGSDTAPVRELIEDGTNGLLVDFFQIDQWVERVLQALDDPAAFDSLRTSARQTILDSYTLPKCLDKMLTLYRELGVGVDADSSADS
ncbi:glycosyltransferase [Planctomycetes bacterium TBK1r]|uniref:Spore coat protein SA n=1 Tax=Stieleria magnilauensis TaxID=2527963 RepID=A0ABX5XS96_9BACT|nr:Spore coat protein SA [Planctomycetes bacterium TBK1r]